MSCEYLTKKKFATSGENPAAKAVAKVTVVTEYDTPDSQKLR